MSVHVYVSSSADEQRHPFESVYLCDTLFVYNIHFTILDFLAHVHIYTIWVLSFESN